MLAIISLILTGDSVLGFSLALMETYTISAAASTTSISSRNKNLALFFILPVQPRV